MKRRVTGFFIVLITGSLFPLLLQAQAQAVDSPPSYVMKEWEGRIGTWIADNSEYQQSEGDPDAFGIEWNWGFAGKSVKGRLYGIREGKDIGTYWEFHIVWHPGQRREVMFQFGSDGTYGVGGTIRKIDEHTHELLQIFYAPDGSVSRTAHRTETRGNTQYGQSYTVSDDGTWTERRSYIWVKQTEGQ